MTPDYNTNNTKLTTHQLESHLADTKTSAQLTLNLLDKLINNANFEPDEMTKVIALRQAILDFKTLEIEKGITSTLTIKESTMNQIRELYGANTDACLNRVINDILQIQVNKELDKDKRHDKSKLGQALKKTN